MSDSLSPPQPLRIDVEEQGDAAVIRLVGSANMDAAADLQERLVELADAPRRRLILDLSGLDFVSSVGLGAIIAAHLRCRHHKCQISLVAPQTRILELLEVTRLTRLFTIHESVKAAMAAEV